MPSFTRQRSFDDLGIPLSEVTFCVIDFETTGSSAETCCITEVGAVKVRAGEVLGTFQTLVNPGQAIPPSIARLTGLTDLTVSRAPGIDQVLPSLLEFIGGSVIVGHNVRFDMAFLQAALRRWGGPMIGNQRLDTLALARRLLVDETPTFKLGDLARRLRLPHQPSHRALDDAWATVDLLHYLIERASTWGVTGIDDLIALPTVAGHPQWKKLSLTTSLPRKPGVYQFVANDGTVLYVGKATNLRSRVRSYFSSDRRKKVAQLLRETDTIRHQVCANTLEAEVVELRLIRSHQPRFNKRGRRAPKPVWIRLTANEPFPRLSITTKPPLDQGFDGAAFLGPLTSRREATAVVEAIQSALPIRRCAGRGRKTGQSECTAAQLGVALCPCTGSLSKVAYAGVVEQVRRAMTTDPELVLSPLEHRMHELAADERFEEAASARDRADAFSRAVARQRRAEMLTDVDRLVVETHNGVRIDLAETGYNPESLEEALCVASWLDRNADTMTVLLAEGTLCSPLPRLPSFKPTDGDSSPRRSG